MLYQNSPLGFHSFAQNLDLLLYFNPQDILLKAVSVSDRHYTSPAVRHLLGHHILIIGPGTVGPPGDGQQSGHKGFLHIRKAKVVRDLGDRCAKLIREVDVLIAGKLGLPELAVGDALLQVWIGEVVFPVEARWPFLDLMSDISFTRDLFLWTATNRDAGIKSIQVIGAADHEDAIIALEAVNLIEEIAPHSVRHDCV